MLIVPVVPFFQQRHSTPHNIFEKRNPLLTILLLFPKRTIIIKIKSLFDSTSKEQIHKPLYINSSSMNIQPTQDKKSNTTISTISFSHLQNMLPFPQLTTTTLIIFLLITTTTLHHHSATARRILHPYFPLDQTISLPPSPSPQPQLPKYPFSTTLSPPNPETPFFPTYPSPPPPPPLPTPTSTSTTFPANISSLVIPSSSSHSSHKTIKVIILIFSLSLLLFLLLSSLIFLLLRRRKSGDIHRLEPEEIKKPRRNDENAPLAVNHYYNTLHLGSPELHPLPPLPRQQPLSSEQQQQLQNTTKEDEEDEFYSPRGSTGNLPSPHRTTLLSPPLNPNLNPKLSPKFNTGFVKSRSFGSSKTCSPSVVLNTGSPLSISSPDSLSDFPAPLPRFSVPPPVRECPIPRTFSPFSPSSTEECSSRASDFSAPPPAPPPPPPVMVWEATTASGGPPELVGPSRGSFGNSGEMGKTKLKPLHWDKVRASSDRSMVWDQFKSNSSSSFQLNEEMIETLFMASSSTNNAKDGVKKIPDVNQENLVLDPKKSQNIAILLRALNVTIEEVCEALREGNTDILGSELLESLLKMAPTKEEERKLKELKDQSPVKLDIAEAFIMAVIDIPFAFQRADAMLYIANFDSETEYLERCFSTLECACKELKSSRMFRKLLEAVLRTGNHMNVGTNRGDAQAFKLDSLLKLVDIKGTDRKTTLLHFVVQEIIRTEGARLAGADQVDEKTQQSTLRDEVEFRKLGLQVVSGLSGELTNVKKAATMDADLLSNEVSKLAWGVTRITEVIKLNKDLDNKKFTDLMSGFLNKAEGKIANVQAQEGIALSMVKGLTEFFHGDSAKEESHPFRLFVVVRDFLSILDRVCKDVSKINERTMVSSGQQVQIPANPIIPKSFTAFSEKLEDSSSDDVSSFSL